MSLVRQKSVAGERYMVLLLCQAGNPGEAAGCIPADGDLRDVD